MSNWALKLCGLALALELYPALSTPAYKNPCALSALNQEQLLAAARQYAARYFASLPSFVCTQVTDQFEAGKKPTHWRKGDSLTSQLIWDQGREERTLQLVNNRPASKLQFWRAPLVSEGEFGNILDSVLGRSSGAVFIWRGYDTIDSKRVAVFDYQVDQLHSSMRLTLGSVETVVGFRGTVYTDESDGTVWRITNNANQFPAELRTKSISRCVDYGQVSIGQKQYVLPVHATVVLDTGSSNIRNELRFDNYRQFGADSHITFSSGDVSTDPPVETIKH